METSGDRALAAAALFRPRIGLRTRSWGAKLEEGVGYGIFRSCKFLDQYVEVEGDGEGRGSGRDRANCKTAIGNHRISNNITGGQ